MKSGNNSRDTGSSMEIGLKILKKLREQSPDGRISIGEYFRMMEAEKKKMNKRNSASK